MNVAFPMRVDAVDKPGGDLQQVSSYIQAASRTASAAGMPFKAEIITDLQCDFTAFDVIHLTNIDRPVDTFAYFLKARACGKPIVLSPIHHSYREIEKFERDGRGGSIGSLTGLMSFRQLELLRSLTRCLKSPELLWPTIRIWRYGVGRAQIDILENAQLILVLGRKEEEDIREDFGKFTDARFECVRHAFDGRRDREPNSRRLRDIDVCVVGRIEARKNQIRILEALELLGISGAFIGKMNPYHKRYCREFHSRVVRSRSKYLGELSHEETLQYMRRSKVHVSASWFEVSSLVDLEAFAEGCSIVASICGCTREILSGNAEYVIPNDTGSIQHAIRNALTNGPRSTNEQSDSFFTTTDDIGKRLFDIYQSVTA